MDGSGGKRYNGLAVYPKPTAGRAVSYTHLDVYKRQVLISPTLPVFPAVLIFPAFPTSPGGLGGAG